MRHDPGYEPPGIKVALPRNGLPELPPYVYGDPARAGQVARLRAAIAASEECAPGPDDEGYEWRREQLAEAGDMAS